MRSDISTFNLSLIFLHYFLNVCVTQRSSITVLSATSQFRTKSFETKSFDIGVNYELLNGTGKRYAPRKKIHKPIQGLLYKLGPETRKIVKMNTTENY